MHTIRVKEKVGREWITQETIHPVNTVRAWECFQSLVADNLQLFASIAITWSEGKKVHGVFRIN